MLLSLVSIAVALLAAEGVVRLAAPQQLISIRPDIWEPADTLGWIARPDVNTTINTGERTVRVYTDSLGMRVAATGQVNAPTRVLLMGDSFMEALQVEYRHSVAALLEHGLSQRLGRPVAVWDAGVDGWDPPQYLVRTRDLLSKYRFDLVIVAIYLGNDVVARRRDYRPPRKPAERHHFHIPHNLSRHEIVNSLLYPVNDYLEVHSQLFIFVRSRLQGLLMHLRLSAVDVPAGIVRRDSTSGMWNLTAQICHDIAAVGTTHDTPVLFVLIPTSFAVEPAEAAELESGYGLGPDSVDLRQPTRLMLRAMEAQGLNTVAAEPVFDSLVRAGEQLYGHVDKHLSPQGHVALDRVLEQPAAALLRTRPHQP